MRMHRLSVSLACVAVVVASYAWAHPFELLSPADWSPVASQAVAAAEALHAGLARPPAPDDDLGAWLDAFADALGVSRSEPDAVQATAAELRRITGVDVSVATDVVLVLEWRGVLADLAALARDARRPHDRPVHVLPAIGWPTWEEMGPEIVEAIERLERLARGGER